MATTTKPAPDKAPEKAPAPEAAPRKLRTWRVSLASLSPLAKSPLDVKAETEDEAKKLFNKANEIDGSVHNYSVRQVEPGTPMDAPALPPDSLKGYALELAKELDDAAREFGPDKARRVSITDERVRQITARLRELAGQK